MFEFSAEDIVSDYRLLLLYIYISLWAWVRVCVCVCVCVSVRVCVLDPFHLQRVSKLYRKYKPVKITQKEHMLIWNSETTQKPKHLSYQTEAAIF